jgi:dTMP kinase
MSQGFFLTFEGLDGSGKTTQLRKLATWLEARGETPLVTRQPGGTRIGDRIRTLLLDSKIDRLSPLAELGLMFADRTQTIQEIIVPALAEGRIVLCDRFTDSTEAYQGGGRQLGSDLVRQLHTILCGGLQPDVTLMLLPGFETSLARARRRNDRMKNAGPDESRFEREDEAFYQRVFDKYREIAARETLRVVTIDSDSSIEEIHRKIVRVVEELLGKRLASLEAPR